MQYFNLLLFQSNSIPCPIQEITEIVTFQWGDLVACIEFWGNLGLSHFAWLDCRSWDSKNSTLHAGERQLMVN